MADVAGNRVLITGGAGFIGGHLARELADRASVTILDTRETPKLELPASVSHEVTDIRNEDAITTAVEAADVVFHHAAAVSVEHSTEDPVGTDAINLEPVLTILEAARRTDTRVVLASSAAIYGHPQELPITESHPTTPASPYGIQKLAADHYARVYHEIYGLETVALRYFNVYGPGQTGGDYAGVVAAFITQALNGDPITVHGDGAQTRDFVFVEDVVDATVAAAETEHVGESFNVATGETISIRSLADQVQTLTNTDSEIVHVDARDGDIDRSRATIHKAQNALNFEPQVPLEEGLARTIDWYRPR